MIVTIALGLVSTDAFLLGSTALPEPLDDADYPWMFWRSVVLESFLAAGAEGEGSSVYRIDVDSKAMRKVT